MNEPRFTYSFDFYPDETHGRWNAAAFAVFKMFNQHIVMNFTASDFNRFRDQLGEIGLTLRKIERVPFHDPESVP